MVAWLKPNFATSEDGGTNALGWIPAGLDRRLPTPNPSAHLV